MPTYIRLTIGLRMVWMVMINKIFYKLKLSILLATSMVFVFGSLKVFATDIDFYQSNDILFYSPEDTVGDCIVKPNNTDYSGGSILNSKQLEQLRYNTPFYKTAVSQPEVADLNIPWQLLAAIHFKEHNLQRDGPPAYKDPAKSDGPFQITDHKSAVGDYTDDQFQTEANRAAKFIYDKAKGSGISFSNDGDIKRILFKYNGEATAYKKQAESLGYDKTDQNNGEGSPYVMNRADARRDPTVEPTKSDNSWGQLVPKTDENGKVVVDKNGVEVVIMRYPANRGVGAFVVYQSISTTCGEGLVSGGYNNKKDAVSKFIEPYKKLTCEEIKKYLGSSQFLYNPSFNNSQTNCLSKKYPGCKQPPLGNCVAFSVYFINRYTSLTGWGPSDGPTGNGKDVANNVPIKSKQDIVVDYNPEVYSIFSQPNWVENDNGHTGVVLGIDKEKKIITVGEASCGSTIEDGVVVSQESLDDWTHPPGQKPLKDGQPYENQTAAKRFTEYAHLKNYIKGI